MASTAVVAPTRRSPRSVERLFEGVTLPGFTPAQTAILLSLTLCTGWSADRVAQKLESITGIILNAEQVYNYHWTWVLRRASDQIDDQGFDIVKVVLSNIGVEISGRGTPMNQFSHPTTVKFAKSWTPKSDGGQQLFPGYTNAARENSKEYLAKMREAKYHKLTPVEEPLLEKFGPTMTSIIREVLKRWALAMREKLRTSPELRPIREKEQVDLIMDYLREFQNAYEATFGKMEETVTGPLGEIKQNTVFIRSTAYGAKVFLGLLMADRLQVIDRKRREERERISYVQLSPSSLEEDSKCCPICQDEMGAQNADGLEETPIKLVVCCGQVFGKSCLKLWLNELSNGRDYRNSCPNCRHKFPNAFIQKLYTAEEYTRRVDHPSQWKDYEIVLISGESSPSPSPRRTQIVDRRRTPINLEVFEEEARRQADLELQRQVAVVDGDVEMQG